MSLIQLSKKPFTQLIKYSSPNNNIVALNIFSNRYQSTKQSVESKQQTGDNNEVVEKPSPYKVSPFQGPFANKAEWAVARVDDLLNAVRRVRNFCFHF
jgi:hypothetical protein